MSAVLVHMTAGRCNQGWIRKVGVKIGITRTQNARPTDSSESNHMSVIGHTLISHSTRLCGYIVIGDTSGAASLYQRFNETARRTHSI